jgi:hypothetical protein
MSLNHENAIGLHTRDDRWGKTYIFCEKHVSITALCNFPFFSSFRTSRKSNLRTALTTQNTTEHYTVLSPTHTQNTTALQPNVFLTRTHLLLVTNKVRLPFPEQTAVKFNWTLHSQYLYVLLTATRTVLAFVRRLLNLVHCVHDYSCKNDTKLCSLKCAVLRIIMLLGIQGKYLN